LHHHHHHHRYQKLGEENSSRKGGVAESVQKEPVCETMNRKFFINTVMLINPDVTNQHAEKMFEEAVEHAHACVMRDLQVIWMRLQEELEVPDVEAEKEQLVRTSKHSKDHPAITMMVKKNFYVNTRTGLSQWQLPFRYHTFRANDIEYNSFCHIIMQHDIMPTSPLSELLHMTPKDLWPNSDMFLKQIKKGLM
jgi:hypothetical protein